MRQTLSLALFACSRVSLHSTDGCGALAYPLSKLTRAAEIDDFNGATLGIAEQDVLGLQITVDDVQFRRREEQEGGAELLGELSRQVQRDPPEIRISK